MLEEKDLQAIAGLIHSEVDQSESRMQQQILQNNEVLLSQFDGKLKQAIDQSENRMMAYMESNIIPQIKAVAEGHQIILDRLPNADKQEQLQSRVEVLERVVVNLRTELEELKKAQ